ncbi:preprotein translocase subunit SecE [Allofustis seminis]|uniref:preprotein translocase subunit SecE n=1 Tax=Allofustis seminis TaxID=166939 RepID=UPI000365D2AD|nr:preprotein translocase subunit SecE [Allofustis seminis]
MNKDTHFIGEVLHEMKQTTWPTSAEMKKYSSRIFGTIFLFALFFWLGDTVINLLLSFL